MRKILAAAILSSLLLFTSCYTVGLAEKSRTVNVTGSGSLEVSPDMVSMDIRVARTADETKDAQTEVNSAVAALLDILTSHGVSEDDINTTSYDFSPEYEYIDGQRILKGQRVSQSLAFSLKGIDEDSTLLPLLLDAVGEVSNITLSSMRYTREDLSSYYGEVKVLAMEDAMAKAQVYAESAGLTLDKAISIIDYSSEPIARESVNVAAKSMMAMAEAPTQTPVADISVSASVNVVFAMK